MVMRAEKAAVNVEYVLAVVVAGQFRSAGEVGLGSLEVPQRGVRPLAVGEAPDQVAPDEVERLRYGIGLGIYQDRSRHYRRIRI